jgi:flagellar export protein FliJ
MKNYDAVIRLRKFEIDEKRQKVMGFEAMINDFRRMIEDLEQQIIAEQNHAGIYDEGHFSYPPFAKAAAKRRDNLKASAEELETQLATARSDLSESYEDLKKIEKQNEIEVDRRRTQWEKREQEELDELGRLRR